MTDDHSIDEGRQAILDALERHQVRYVVIGGAAAQARGWPEPTDDIDVTPERSEDNLTRLAAAVQELDAGFRVDPARYPRRIGRDDPALQGRRQPPQGPRRHRVNARRARTRD
ncbi:MAG TPA: hypothetical protein VMU32_01630 [Solirubrobacteraceae bacterium]|nr:hypothetical protein [Solirubrobacteraceae bacterium]